MHVVVVESPAKAKTVGRYLGSDYRVFASSGHVSDLPAKDGSVRPDDGFAMPYDRGPLQAVGLAAHRGGLCRGSWRPASSPSPSPSGSSSRA